jgi:hypothetical protein
MLGAYFRSSLGFPIKVQVYCDIFSLGSRLFFILMQQDRNTEKLKSSLFSKPISDDGVENEE